jgi:uncharacterized protein (TIGR02271 family)
MAKDYDRDDMDRDADRHRPSNEPQVAPLGDLGDYEVAEGYPDPRGWTVSAADGAPVGEVKDLIVDTGTMRTRYLQVRLASELASSGDDRDVLVPIGTARIDDAGDSIRVDGLGATQFASLPPYERDGFSRDHEAQLRDRFSPGTAQSAGTIGAGAAGAGDFYDHEHFDDRNFFSRGRDRGRDRGIGQSNVDNESERLTVSEEQLDVGKRQVAAGEVGVRKQVETEHVEQEVSLRREEVDIQRRPINAESARDVQIGEDEIRIPVMREEAVVQKRMVPTEEIIIRKTAKRDTETVSADLKRERVDVDDSTVRNRDERLDRR